MSGDATGPVVVDAMGGDHAPDTVVRGALRAAAQGLDVVLVGDPARLEPLCDGRLQILPASQTIGMEESPLTAVRSKPDSSIRIALEQVESGAASAMVSCGHSGAVVIEAVRTLRLMEGAERAALAVRIPRPGQGPMVLLDVGANVDCRPEHLLSFALVGSAWARTLGIDAPRIGVLSNGEEASKGNALVRATLSTLDEAGIRAVPMEPGPAVAGGVDVLVCDGFVGNVALKAMEAALATLSRFIGADGRGGLSDATSALSRQAQGGALLLGVGGVAVVGHGSASDAAVESAIVLAHHAARRGLVDELRSALGTSATA